jgi:putative oxidoreductase
MNETQLQSTGITVLRVSLGIVLLAHSLYLKLMIFSLSGTAGYFESIGLPGALAYLTFFAEVITGIALIAGFRVRIAALMVVPFLLGATWAHWANGWLFSNANGGWEYPLFMALVAIALAFIGEGPKVATASNDPPVNTATASV